MTEHTVDYAEKTKEWLKQSGRGSVIATVAAKGYRRHRRGHVMALCKKTKMVSKHNVPTFQYIAQQHNRHMVSLEPLAQDPALDRMVQEYDPDSQAVVVAFWGEKYLRLTIGIEPEPARAEGEH